MDPAPNPKEASIWKDQGDIAFKQRDYYTAASMYTAAIAYDETNHVPQGNLSAAWLKLHCFRGAVFAAQAAIDLKPDWAKGHARLALALMELGNFSTAITAYQRAISLEPQNKEWRTGLEELYRVMEDKKKGPPRFKLFADAEDLSRSANQEFMENVWDANDWWYLPTSLDNPRHTYQEQRDYAMKMTSSDFRVKTSRYADMGFSKDINILRGPSVMLHPSFMVKDKDAFFKDCQVNGVVPDVVLWAPDISVHYLLTMITDEADMRRFNEVTFYMTTENIRLGETISKQKLKWQEELLQRAWKEAMRVEELHPLTLILYYAMHTRYRNQAREEKYISLLRDFINICAKMKIDGFRGLLEAKFEYTALLQKRGNSEELKSMWKNITNFKGTARHKHEERFFAIVKNDALTNLAVVLIGECKYDEAWQLYQEAFEIAISNGLDVSVKSTMINIMLIFLSNDWRTFNWRFDEAVKFFKKARGYPTFPKRIDMPSTADFWPQVLQACSNPGEQAAFFGGAAPPHPIPLSERLVPNKKLAVDRMCAYCHKLTAKSLCAGCKREWYCNKECQKSGWSIHKTLCKELSKI